MASSSEHPPGGAPPIHRPRLSGGQEGPDGTGGARHAHRSGSLSGRRTGSISDFLGRGSTMTRAGSNPLRLGTPRRKTSLADVVTSKCKEYGGDHPIHGVLVANNGIAAVKFMRSIRNWSYRMYGDDRAVSIVAIATPEDMRIDAEHIRMADQFVEVPGGANNFNYANVPLIVSVADRANVDAVWPGWGHASEKPELPAALTTTSMRFLGPPADAMAALGDKIGSTILAQAAGVPTIPWSGSDVAISFEQCNGQIPAKIYDQACLHNLDETLVCCNKIGYPVMLKASWGGGGKGIRKVMNDEDTKRLFPQVQGEVPGSPIFAMKLAPASRHLEVQLIADRHGNVASLFSRDCSVQRRHQKIVEEGPVTKASAETLKEMERCARSLARSVGYQGAATVEYLYSLAEGKYYFLELNPRLQVEHPVTEWISGTNIPSIQMMVGMGCPLYRIPEIRQLYQADPEGDSVIDFENTEQRAPKGHVVAVRVTSEDANDGFKPTCGAIEELTFKPSPDVWGYFSVKSGGGIHEFSDSQFGHLFAKGDDRPGAIRAMVVALKELKIRGEIRSTVDYTAEMVQSRDFVGNNIHTGWLDSRIATHVKAEKPSWHLAIISGAVLRTLDWVAARSAEYLGYLEKGQLPPARLTLTALEMSLVLDGFKYAVKVTRQGPQAFRLFLGNSQVDVVARRLNDGGLLVQVDGAAHVVHHEEESIGTRLMIDSLTCLLANETDPSRLLAASPGKFVKCVIADGEHVPENLPYAEIEVMKMVMPLISPAAGKVHYQLLPGAIMKAGDLIANLEMDDPAAITKAQPYTEDFPEMGPPLVYSSNTSITFKQNLDAAQMIMAGYDHPVEAVVTHLLEDLDKPDLAVQLWADAFSVVQNRLPPQLSERLTEIIEDYNSDLLLGKGTGQPGALLPGLAVFPAADFKEAMDNAVKEAAPADQPTLSAVLESLRNMCKRFEKGMEAFARSIACELLQSFLDVEERFSLDQDATEQEVIDDLRQLHSKALGKVVDIVVSHQGLSSKLTLVEQLLNALVLPSPEHYRPLLRRLAVLGGGSVELAGKAQLLLEQSLLGELQTVVARSLSGLDMFAGSQLSPMDLNTEFSTSEGKLKPVERRLTISEGLYSGLNKASGLATTQMDAKMQLLVEAPAAVEDALASLLDDQDPQLQGRALLTYIRRIYYTILLRNPKDVHRVDDLACVIWLYTHEGENTLGAALVMPSLDVLPDALPLVEAAAQASGVNHVPRGALHVILTASGDSALRLSEGAQGFRSEAMAGVAAFTAATFLDGGRELDPRATAEAVHAQIRAVAEDLARAGYVSVSVLTKRGRLTPLRIGFWRRPEIPVDASVSPSQLYRPDVLLCAVEPPVATVLELQKLSAFKNLVYSPSRNRQCHTFTVLEKRDARSLTLKRVFLRGLVRQLGRPSLLAASYRNDYPGVAAAAVEEMEASMAVALQQLNRLYVAHGEKEATRADWAHIFLAVLPPQPLGTSNTPADSPRIAAALRAAAAAAMARHGTELRRTAVAQWEVRIPVGDSSGAWRLVVSLPTGHEVGEESVQIYREVMMSSGEGPVYELADPLPGNAADPLDGTPMDAPYPPLQKLQQKRLAARRHKTTYCYDFPSVFANALQDRWTERAVAGEPGEVPKGLLLIPAVWGKTFKLTHAGRLVVEQELVMAADGNYAAPASVAPITRSVGQNDVGIVAWLLHLKTPEYPQGRTIVAVANDITFSSGAFGPREDAAFLAFTEYAVAERLPLIYLAANSGARVGLANEVKQRMQIEWNVPEDPMKGFKYTWLSEADYETVTSRSRNPVIKAHSIETEKGETRWVITDIVGGEDGLGVECLSGSGAIAAAYARAFRDGFTLTLVSGRTVGIGAYLARLGRRCIQRADQPIILTGFNALNKLLGREVYTSQLQLGGPKVMGVNGVSHAVVADDLAGVSAVLQWLSFTPNKVGSLPPKLISADPAVRSIGYAPAEGERLDPRAAIAGVLPPEGTENQAWKSGLFDKGSWCEMQSGWARSVVTGRARLSGIPVGVIAVETQTVMLNIPADPGAPDSSERAIPQAGQVWFPDSALKTAHAMEEFDREGLPLIILANWRGFSGGQRDLFEGVLQAGSLIVDSLSTYHQPVMVYLAPGAELRGGAWVVVDGRINSDQVEMYADPSARGGVLEPEGVVEIKFKKPDLIGLMNRLDPQIAELRRQGGAGDAAIAARQNQLLPVYHQVAVSFAEMHDTPVRMVAKGVLHGIVPWDKARPFLAIRLKRRLAEEEVMRHITITDPIVKRGYARGLVQAWFLHSAHDLEHKGNPFKDVVLDTRRAGIVASEDATLWCNDAVFLLWFDTIGATIIAQQLKELRAAAATRALLALTRSNEGRRGLLDGLAGLTAADPNLRVQMMLMLTEQEAGSRNGGRPRLQFTPRSARSISENQPATPPPTERTDASAALQQSAAQPTAESSATETSRQTSP